MRQSSPGRTASLKIMPRTGTRRASTGMLRTRAAKNPLAATGRKPGACGSSRAATFRATKKATSSKSIQRFARLSVGDIGSIPLIVRATLSTPAAMIAIVRLGLRRAAFRPFANDGGHLIEPVGQRRWARLQNQRRLYFTQPAGGDGGNFGKAGPGGDFPRYEFLAAPGSDDDVRPSRDDLVGRHDPILGILARSKLRKDVNAAGGFDQLGHPGDSGNHWLVPLLEIDARVARQTQRTLVDLIDVPREGAGEGLRFC